MLSSRYGLVALSRISHSHYFTKSPNWFLLLSTKQLPKRTFATSPKTTTATKNNNHHQKNQNFYSFYQNVYFLVKIFFPRMISVYSIVYYINEFGFSITMCEGPSMMPTIHPFGEIVLIEKMSHRYWGFGGGGCVGEERARVAREKQKIWEEKESSSSKKDDDEFPTWHDNSLRNKSGSDENASILVRIYNLITTPLQKGDVIVLENATREGTVCKRILGLPGDIIVRPGNVIRSNGDNNTAPEHARMAKSLIEELMIDDETGEWIGTPSSERDSRNRIMDERKGGGGLFVVPDGHVWVEGDNTMNSKDSREYGPVPGEMIVGRVWMRVWPARPRRRAARYGSDDGQAFLGRGVRPIPGYGMPFSGSTVLPAGYEGETIVSEMEDE